MKAKKYSKKQLGGGCLVLAAVLCGMIGGTTSAWSAGTLDGGVPVPQPVESYYSNPAQAAHAAQLAEKAVQSDQRVQDAIRAYEEARATYLGLKTEATKEEIAAAREQLTVREKACTELMAEVAGVASTDLAAMRASGMGWGDIAHDLGVHPSALGLGQSMSAKSRSRTGGPATGISGIAPEELAEATARNTRNGWAKEQGTHQQAGIHDPGTGLSSPATAGAAGLRGSGRGLPEGETRREHKEVSLEDSGGLGGVGIADLGRSNNRSVNESIGGRDNGNDNHGNNGNSGNNGSNGNSGSDNGNAGSNAGGSDNGQGGSNSGNSGSNAGGNDNNGGGNDNSNAGGSNAGGNDNSNAGGNDNGNAGGNGQGGGKQ